MKYLAGLIGIGLWAGHVAAADLKWMTDVSQAKTLARQENKLVYINFTGSDFCAQCKLLHERVFSTSQFAAYARSNLVLVEMDFPEKKPQSPELRKANEAVKKSYEVEGFPTVIILNSQGKEIARDRGYPGTPPDDYLKRLQRWKK